MVIDAETLKFAAFSIGIVAPVVTTAYNVGKLKQMVFSLVKSFDEHKREHENMDGRIDKISEDVAYMKGYESK